MQSTQVLWDCKIQERIRFRLLVLDCPKYYISPFQELIGKWVEKNGIEWTISRLKSLKVDLLRRKASLPSLTWIRKNRSGDIAGVVGGLFRWSDKSDKNFRRLIQILMVYSVWILPEVTEKQLQKFKTAVTAPPTVVSRDLINLCKKEAYRFRTYQALRLPEPIIAYEGSSEKNSPTPFSKKSVKQNSKVLNELFLFNTTSGITLYTKYPRVFHNLLKGFGPRRAHLDRMALKGPSKYVCDTLVGKIAFIQEPGGKLRSVASPFRLFQMALKPLGDRLYRIAEQMPWDCTHDQSRAFQPVQDHLNKHKIVYSVDLSSATDYFPLSLQEEIIRTMFDHNDHDFINLWVELSQGSWNLPNSSDTISWKRGQPLGMFPSFAAFTISHGILLKSLLDKKWEGEFYVVGDDVVILDDNLASKYMNTLEELGCPFSIDKTLQSHAIAEFAGKIITSDNVYPQMKWRNMSDDNFLDICRMLGPKSRLLLDKRQKKIFDAVANLMTPIGLNFSLPNDNLEKVIFRTMKSKFWNPEQAILNSLMGLRKRINTHLYEFNSASESSQSEILEIIQTFDEKVVHVMKQTIFNCLDSVQTILGGLASLPQALDLPSRLPLERKLPSRVTTLERYESILNS